MRIVHVSDCYPPRTGGIESHVSDLAHRQVERGHEVHVLTATLGPGGEGRGAVQDHGGVQVHRLATRMPFDAPLMPGAGLLARDVLDTVRPDVVHVHAGVLSPFAYACTKAARSRRVPTAITWHSMLDRVQGPGRALAALGGWRRTSAALSAVSAASAGAVQSIMRAPVEVLPNGIDAPAWRQSDVDPRHYGPTLHAVATMRMVPRKRAVPLIDVMAEVLREVGPDGVRLTLVGDGPTLGLARRRVARHGLQGVVDVRGVVPRQELHGIYRTAQVFVAPARREAFGIAPLEARAAGLALVVQRGTGTAEFIADEREGLVVDDDAGLAAAIVRLAREPDLLERIRRHNLVTPPVFAWSEVLRAAEHQYARARQLHAREHVAG